MKKVQLNQKKLQLNKEKITSLTPDQASGIGGGAILGPANNTVMKGWTGGCSDGQLCHSHWNCTKQQCSDDCPLNASKLICPTPETSVQSKYCR